jgi:type I restriction-modification system DNA methylase subunit
MQNSTLNYLPMSSPSQEQAKTELKKLIESFRILENRELQSEANVRANFIDPLFEILAWPIRNPVYYNREEYVRGAGYADVALKADPTADIPLIFVEAKRFGAIEHLDRVQDRRNRDVAQLKLQLPGISVDRTREEQQAINYAYQKGMQWAILTNFEHFRLFNARRDTLVLSFDTPHELLDRFEELWQLAFDEVRQGSLEGLRAHRERLDIDEEYLRLINLWRLRLGQDIISHRENRILLEDPVTREINIYALREAVQRILDRLVVIRYAEDRLVIRGDQLLTIVELRTRTDYGMPLLDQIRHFFFQFNVQHNGTLFSDHLCDRLTISEAVLHAIIDSLYDARFRAMSADIMGNTYEQYLGQTLSLRNGEVQSVDNLETRKAQGSYYTPEYIVRYIVEQTLGRYLYATYSGRPDGEPISGEQPKRLEDIDGSDGRQPLRILDPACGSGSFLMNAYHLLEEFYESEIRRTIEEQKQRHDELFSQGLVGLDLQVQLSTYKHRLDRLKDYKNQILERHLYGVDLDPQAAELAAVNLMLRAMTRNVRLPLILNQNVKIGNSLLSGMPVKGGAAIESFAAELAELRRVRLAQQGVAQDSGHPFELQGQFERLAQQVNSALNEGLTNYFGDAVSAKRPFNWVVEFPEVFVDENGKLREGGGFTMIIGNPPYLNVDETWGQHSADAAYVRNAFADIWSGKSDIYYYFIRRGLSLLAPGGQLGFITARYYLEAFYAQNLRQVMLAEAALQQIVDFGNYTVFPRVGTKTAISLLRKEADETARTGHELLFDKVTRKQTDLLLFLQSFRETAHSFRQGDLDSDSWNLFGQAVAQLIARIDNRSERLGKLTFIGQGMQTGRNDVFVIDQATVDRCQIEATVIRKNIKNQDIKPYNLAFRGLYLLYPEEIENLDNFPRLKAYLAEHRTTLEERAAFKRGDCEWWRFTWPLHKDRYRLPKIVTPFIARENRFALDRSAEYVGLTDTYALFPIDDSPNLYYLLALLNSKLLNFRFRYIGKAKDYRYEYVENSLKKIPIRLASTEGVEQLLIQLAQQMTELSFLRQTLYDEFEEMLEATIYTVRDFYGAYYDHSEYQGTAIRRVGAADANATGTTTKIFVSEMGTRLVFKIVEADRGKIKLIELEVPDNYLRHFLLLGIRADLFKNELKQIWSRGRLLQGTLGALRAPVLVEAAAAANIERIHRFMAELKQRVSEKVNPTSSSFTQALDDILNLGRIETALSQTQQQIDQLVFQLYGIESPDEIQLIQEILAG